MAPGNKGAKSKLTQDASLLQDSLKETATGKLLRKDLSEGEDDDMLIGTYQARIKKRKVDPETEAADIRTEILNFFNQQRQARKQYSDNIFKNISEITSQIEADYNVMKENERKLEHLANTYMKCIRQATIACEQKLSGIKKIETIFKSQLNKMESEHKDEIEKLMEKLTNDIKKLEEKFNKESKRKSLESLRRNIFHAMQNDHY